MLTSYNGHTNTYDEIGNPLTYYNCEESVKTDDGCFIGFSADAHLGLGGHFKVGWDVGEFFKILFE